MTNSNETISYSIGKGIIDGARATRKGLANVCKYIAKEPLCFTYPILGNLSGQIQERIETATNGKYNVNNAVLTSTKLNYILYPTLIPYLGYETNSEDAGVKILLDFLIAGSYVCFEGDIRKKGELELYEILFGNPISIKASLPGKLASLPLEAILGVYDGIRGRK